MSLETDWQVREYAKDIHCYLRTKEQKRVLYHAQSPQLHMRKNLVEWLILICERLDFCKNVQHLAVYLLDIFMDNHTIFDSHLKLVSLGCLALAVKLEEREGLVLPNSHLNALVGNRYRNVEFYRMEITILKFFKWDILFPTAAHFLEYYVLHALNPNDYQENDTLPNYDVLKLYFQKYIDYFLEVSLKDVIFLKLNPSLVAASCILSARLCLGLSPPWPVKLQGITFYKYADLKPCISILLRTINTEVLSKKFTHMHTFSILPKNIDCGYCSSQDSNCEVRP